MFALRSIFAKELRRTVKGLDDISTFFYVCLGGALIHAINVIFIESKTLIHGSSTAEDPKSFWSTWGVLLLNGACFFMYNQVSAES
jgi:hypothetical protein